MEYLDPLGDISDRDAIRELAGKCYLTMRTGDPRLLGISPSREALVRSGLAGTYANLCLEHGVSVAKEDAIEGVRLAATNARRWDSLLSLLDSLRVEGLDPVLFKGGVLHAKWPGMRRLRAMFDYDLIVPQSQVEHLRRILCGRGYSTVPAGSRLTQRLSKGWMVWKGEGLSYQNLDIHARVTEPPVCSSLSRSILAATHRAEGVRIPDLEDCVSMIALHVVRSGMHRPLREYIDLLWFLDDLDEAGWRDVESRAAKHHLLPALFLSLRQALHCLALDRLDPDRANRLGSRLAAIGSRISIARMWALDRLAPADYPLHPMPSRDRPLFRRSAILGAGTGSPWRVLAAFSAYGFARLGDSLLPGWGEAPTARRG